MNACPRLFADRFTVPPRWTGQARRLPDNARQCGRVESAVIRWSESDRSATTVEPPPGSAPSRATTNHPTHRNRGDN